MTRPRFREWRNGHSLMLIAIFCLNYKEEHLSREDLRILSIHGCIVDWVRVKELELLAWGCTAKPRYNDPPVDVALCGHISSLLPSQPLLLWYPGDQLPVETSHGGPILKPWTCVFCCCCCLTGVFSSLACRNHFAYFWGVGNTLSSDSIFSNFFFNSVFSNFLLVSFYFHHFWLYHFFILLLPIFAGPLSDSTLTSVHCHAHFWMCLYVYWFL